MAFVAVVPAVGSVIAGTAGVIGSGLAAAGGLASSIPVVGSALTGLGGAVGSLGAGIGGTLTGGGLSALTGGLSGAGHALLGSAGAGGSLGSGLLGMGQGLGSIYAGADKLVGGLLPNLGVGGTLTPSQGYLGSLFPNAVGSNPMFGGQANPFATHGVVNPDFNNPFDLAQMQGLTQPTQNGIGGILGKGLGFINGIGEKAGALNTVRNIFDPPEQPGAGVYGNQVITRPTTEAKPIILGGGQTPVNQQLNLAGQPTAMIAAPQVGAGLGVPGGYRDEISELVEDIIEGKDNDDNSRQSDSLRGTYGGRTTSLA